jgi:hypothetical protein
MTASRALTPADIDAYRQTLSGGNFAYLPVFLEHYPVDANTPVDRKGGVDLYPLDWATHQGNTGMVLTLLHHGGRWNGRGAFNPLRLVLCAGETKDRAEKASLLLAHKDKGIVYEGDPDNRSKGATPLCDLLECHFNLHTNQGTLSTNEKLFDLLMEAWKDHGDLALLLPIERARLDAVLCLRPYSPLVTTFVSVVEQRHLQTTLEREGTEASGAQSTPKVRL